jgi:hypothetical protein
MPADIDFGKEKKRFCLQKALEQDLESTGLNLICLLFGTLLIDEYY